jgi:hypothetical protein
LPAYSLCLLLVLMIDKGVALILPHLSFISSRYLLILSYSGILYTLAIALMDSRKPLLIECATSSPSFLGYLRHKSNRVFFFVKLLLMSLGAVLLFLFLLIPHKHIVSLVPILNTDLITAGSLLVFYGIFFYLLFMQSYFLARRNFRPLALSWCLALGVRFISLFSSNLYSYLGLCILSGLAALVPFLFLIKSEAR